MIQELTRTDYEALSRLVNQDTIHNLQFVACYPYLGGQDSRFGFYGYFEDRELAGALYYSPFNMGITVKDHVNPAVFREKLSTLPSSFLYGKKRLLTSVLPLPDREEHPYCYGKLPIGKLPTVEAKHVVQASSEDLKPLLAFYYGKNIQLEMYEFLPSLIEEGLVFLIKDDGKVISSALAHSRSSDSCLIGAVYTDPAYQGQRLAYYSVLALTRHIHQQGLTPYLFFEDHLPHLHRFYSKFGFEKEADYIMLHE